MGKIKLLERIIIESNNDGTQISRLPNNEEMMYKINEIINVVNRLNGYVSEIKEKNENNPFKGQPW